MSWECKNCKTESDDTIGICWKCGYSREGIPRDVEPVPTMAPMSHEQIGGLKRVLKKVSVIMLVVSSIILLVGAAYEFGGRSKIASANNKLRQLQTEDNNLDQRAKEQNDEARRQIRQRQGTGLFAIPRMYFTLPQDEGARRRIQQERVVATNNIASGVEMRQKADKPISYGAWGIVVSLVLLLASRSKRTALDPRRQQMSNGTTQTFCVKCGAKLVVDSAYCGKCGTKV